MNTIPDFLPTHLKKELESRMRVVGHDTQSHDAKANCANGSNSIEVGRGESMLRDEEKIVENQGHVSNLGLNEQLSDLKKHGDGDFEKSSKLQINDEDVKIQQFSRNDNDATLLVQGPSTSSEQVVKSGIESRGETPDLEAPEQICKELITTDATKSHQNEDVKYLPNRGDLLLTGQQLVNLSNESQTKHSSFRATGTSIQDNVEDYGQRSLSVGGNGLKVEENHNCDRSNFDHLFIPESSEVLKERGTPISLSMQSTSSMDEGEYNNGTEEVKRNNGTGIEHMVLEATSPSPSKSTNVGEFGGKYMRSAKVKERVMLCFGSIKVSELFDTERLGYKQDPYFKLIVNEQECFRSNTIEDAGDDAEWGNTTERGHLDTIKSKDETQCQELPAFRVRLDEVTLAQLRCSTTSNNEREGKLRIRFEVWNDNSKARLNNMKVTDVLIGMADVNEEDIRTAACALVNSGVVLKVRHRI